MTQSDGALHANVIILALCLLCTFQAENSQLFVTLKGGEHRKRSPLAEHTGTLPADWKQRDCFNELGKREYT